MTTEAIVLSPRIRGEIDRFAQELWPREAVALLAGAGDTVTHFAPLPNVASNDDRFAVEPAAFMRSLAELEATSKFLGFVHSHKNGSCALSAVDHRELWRDCLQLVVGVKPDGVNEIAGYRLIGDATVVVRIVDGLEKDGFALHEGVFDNCEIDAIVVDLEHARLSRSRAGARHALGHPPINRLALDPRLLAIAHKALGPRAVPFRATLFDKNSSQNWLVAWHQDTALPLTTHRDVKGWGPWSIKANVHYAHAPATALEQVLALRVHLDDSSAENGALRMVPGSHRLGVLDRNDIAGIAHKSRTTVCALARGGVLALRPLVIHSSSKTRSDRPRRVLHLEYAASHHSTDGFELATA